MEQTRPFDPSPLREPVDRAAVRAWEARNRVSGANSTAQRSLGIIGTVIGGFVAAAVFASAFAAVVSALGRMRASGRVTASLAVPLAIALVVIALVVVGIVAAVRGRSVLAERRYRLDRFARANGMGFTPAWVGPNRPGMIFGQGGSRLATDIVRGERPRFVEFANYSYTTGSGKNRRTHRWGYVAIRLDTPLPNIVLDARSNDGLFGSNLPATFGRDQVLRLEGDFDRYFTLYCPTGYEADALYLFTPDIMARFIDNAAALDVEIVDDWLFLYSSRDLSTLDAATWEWLFGAVGALLDKFAQWGRWRDERLRDAAPSAAAPSAASVASVPAGGAGALPFAAPSGLLTPPPRGVAAPGRRLRRRAPVALIVVIALFWLLWITQSGFLGRLFG